MSKTKSDKDEWGVFDFMGEYIRLRRDVSCGMRELSLAEQKDISYLVENKYISFFTNPDSDCEGASTGFLGSWNYPERMLEFKNKVGNAYSAIYNYKGYNGIQPVWAEMRNKYYDGQDYVNAEDMMEQHIKDFSTKEVIAALHYCSIYKERFCDGAYGYYAKEGYIGKLLLKLKGLPLSLS